MSRLIPFLVDACESCRYMIHKTDVKRPGFYCNITGTWIKGIHYINSDCPFPNADENETVMSVIEKLIIQTP